MDDEDIKELTGLVTDLGKDMFVDWAVTVAASAAVGAIAGTVVPGAGNAAGTVSGAVVGTVNAAIKIKKGKKYIKGTQQIIKVSKKIIEKKKVEKLYNYTPKGKNIFEVAENGAKVDAKAVSKTPVKEILDNLVVKAQKLGDDIVDNIKEVSESALRELKTGRTDYSEANKIKFSDTINKIEDVSRNMWPKKF